MTVRHWLALVLLFAAAAPSLPPPAWAGPPPRDEATDKARTLFSHAEALYTLERWSEALAEYERAFEIKPLPGFLFNIAQCHRQLGNYAKAAYFYGAYLDKNPKAPNRETALALQAEMRARAETNPGPPVTPIGTGTPGNPALTPKKQPDPLGLKTQTPEKPPEETPLYRRWWVWTIVGGVVVAGAATGIGVAASREPMPPQGTLGTIDVR